MLPIRQRPRYEWPYGVWAFSGIALACCLLLDCWLFHEHESAANYARVVARGLACFAVAAPACYAACRLGSKLQPGWKSTLVSSLLVLSIYVGIRVVTYSMDMLYLPAHPPGNYALMDGVAVGLWFRSQRRPAGTTQTGHTPVQ